MLLVLVSPSRSHLPKRPGEAISLPDASGAGVMMDIPMVLIMN